MAETAATAAAERADMAATAAQEAVDALMQAQMDLEAAMMGQTTAEGERDDAQMMVDAAMQANMNARGRHLTAAIEFLYSNATTAADADENTVWQGATPQTGTIDADKTAASPNIADAPTDLEMSLSADGELGVKLDNTAPLEFEEYSMSDYGPPAIDGWMGATLSRRNNADSAEQIVYAYTDIGAESEKPFSSVHGLTVALQGDDTDASNLDPRADSSSFPTLVTDDTQTFTNVHLPIPGMYDGVPGTFTCSGGADGATCMVSVFTDGTRQIQVSNAATTFVFEPTDNQAAVTVAASDNHLYFGFWLHKPTIPIRRTHLSPLWAAILLRS
jgi:hypothetical protein